MSLDFAAGWDRLATVRPSFCRTTRGPVPARRWASP